MNSISAKRGGGGSPDPVHRRSSSCNFRLATVSHRYMDQKIKKTEEEWRKELSPEQYRILRQKGTEAPFTGIYESEETPGVYRCAACGQDLFTSETKFHSGSGWPSFYQPIDLDRVDTHEDVSHGMRRVEVTCSRCGGHLGHVFPDGPNPTGTRFCINSASLKLDPEKK
jgi:peptide-methionine (R)-S-oxide reductase